MPFFQPKKFTYESGKVTKCPKHGSRTLVHLWGLSGPRECHLGSFGIKIYSYKTPLRIHTQHRCLGKHRRHISLLGKWFIRRPALMSRSTLSWAGRPLTCWGRPHGKWGFGWACLATLGTVTVVSLFGTFDILDLISKSRSFSMKQS